MNIISSKMYMDQLPNEILIEIMKNMDNETLIQTAISSRRHNAVAHTVARDRYREIYGDDIPDWPLGKLLAITGPVMPARNLNQILENGNYVLDEKVDDEANNAIAFYGSDLLYIQIDGIKDVLSDPQGNQARPDIMVEIDMTEYGSILSIGKLMDILAYNVDERFSQPLSNGARIIHGIENAYLRGSVYLVYTRYEIRDDGEGPYYRFILTD
jgi:hypothetical protein